MNNWTYKGITIERATIGPWRWTCLVDLPGYAGYLRATSKQEMRDLINHYSKKSNN